METLRTCKLKLDNKCIIEGCDNERYHGRKCSKCVTLWRKYRITDVDRSRMLADQNHKCGICFVDIKLTATKHCANSTKRGSAVVDHCHSTNKIRGMLCGNCNVMIGQAQDDVDILLSAIRYLNRKDT